MREKKVSIVSLGCPKNLVDSEIMTALLEESHYTLTTRVEEAEVIVVNTCGFIETAKEESIETILELARCKEGGRCKTLIVSGCLTQRYHKELSEELPEVDHFIGTGEFIRLPEIIGNPDSRRVYVDRPRGLNRDPLPRIISTPEWSAYVKISEGCSNHCTYCTIPMIRGELESRTTDSILREVKDLAGKGIKEINLIAQDITSFGMDKKGSKGLEGLLEKLVRIRGIEWIRLLYTHPLKVSDHLLKIIRDEEKMCKYIDLPLQHINDGILGAMNRGIDKDDIKRLIASIREIIPEVTLRTTFIVGFPGEGEKEFEELLEFVNEIGFDRLGVFEYSREEGTPAFGLPGHVSKKVKKERYQRLMGCQAEISLKKNKELKGSVLKVLVEKESDSPFTFQGRIEGQAPDIDGVTFITNKGKAAPGEILELIVTDPGVYDLVGEIIN